MHVKKVSLLLFLVCMIFSDARANAGDLDVVLDLPSISGISSLPARCKSTVGNLDVYRFNFRGAVCVVVPVKKVERLSVALSSDGKTAPTSAIARANAAKLAVNGGYFNLSDGESASFVTADGKQVADPRQNKALTGNKKLEAFMPAILNRSELRLTKDKKGNYALSIARHEDALPPSSSLVHALQGGPRLLPTLTSSEEAFVRTEEGGKSVDSIGVNRTAARTAIGICENGSALLLSCAGKGQDEFSSGLTLSDLAALAKSLGAREALNFDGGTSTTLVIAEKDGSEENNYRMLVGRNPETRVRSILCVRK